MTHPVDLTQLTVERAKPADPPRRRIRWISRYVLPVSLLIGFAALAAWASWDRLFPPQQVMVVPVLATSTPASRAGTPLFKAAGWIEPRPTPIRVPALAPGVVSKLLVVEDQSVEKGDIVAELVRDDAELAYRDAMANLRLQEANLEQARAEHQAAVTRLEKPVHLRAALAEADAMLAQVETELSNLPHAARRAAADMEFARSNLDGKLAAQGAVAGRDLERAQSRVDAAQALVDELRDRESSLHGQKTALTTRRDALRTQLELLVEEVRDRRKAAARVEAAKARLEMAQVAVASAELRLKRMSVRAPAAGRIYQLIAYPGTSLSAGPGPGNTDSSTVVTLYQPDRLQVRVDVRFDDVPHVTLGQPVEITNPVHPERLTGRVLLIGSEADIQKNTLEVKVAIDSPPAVFKPEMLVDATFLAPEAASDEGDEERIHIYAPRHLVHHEGAGTFVWVADRFAQVARKTPVTVGSDAHDDLVHIVSGLDRTSRLIASGESGLRDGSRIVVVGEFPAAQSPETLAPRPSDLSHLPLEGG